MHTADKILLCRCKRFGCAVHPWAYGDSLVKGGRGVDLAEILHTIFFLLALPEFSPLFWPNLGVQLPPPPCTPASYAHGSTSAPVEESTSVLGLKVVLIVGLSKRKSWKPCWVGRAKDTLMLVLHPPTRKHQPQQLPDGRLSPFVLGPGIRGLGSAATPLLSLDGAFNRIN